MHTRTSNTQVEDEDTAPGPPLSPLRGDHAICVFCPGADHFQSLRRIRQGVRVGATGGGQMGVRRGETAVCMCVCVCVWGGGGGLGRERKGVAYVKGWIGALRWGCTLVATRQGSGRGQVGAL